MVVYLHGFNSSPDSFKANLLKRYLEAQGRAREFSCPSLPWRFAEAAALIDAELRRLADSPITLVGSSLGGYYAAHFAEKYCLPAVLVNPAAYPYLSLAKYLGPQKNPYTGADYLLTVQHIEELKALEVARITRPERYLLLTQTGDEVLDYREAVAKFAGAEQVVIEGGDHAFRDFADHLERVMRFADAHGVPPRLNR